MNASKLRAVLLGAAISASASAAYADSITDYVNIEIGAGAQHSKDMGDGTWIQQGSPGNFENTTSTAFQVGLTGQVATYKNASLDWHVDYVYMAGMKAGCDCVPDANYNAVEHKIILNPSPSSFGEFNGSGHTQGFALTLSPGYTYDGWKVSADLGAWGYWATWHESLVTATGSQVNANHVTKPEIGYVIGARVERGNFGVSYRYYKESQAWDAYPGLVTGSQMLALTYQF